MSNVPTCGSAWVLFDADNTLWAVEHLYDNSRRALVEFLALKGVDPVKAEEFQQGRDTELHSTYGYSACRFPQSFEDTVLHFLPDSPDVDVRHVRQLALAVFDQPAQVVEGLEEVLAALDRLEYRKAIITAGERWVQKRRLDNFHLREQFSAIEVVEVKTAEVLGDFCDRHQVDRASSWMVGDSIPSDILPAREAGLRTVLLDAKNWALVERDRQLLPTDVPMIKNLRELIDLITPI